MENKRKHHIVPRCYLKNFAARDDKVWMYRLDNPKKPFHKNYGDVGHMRDYYAQPKPDGTIDYNTLEDYFDRTVESNWTPLVQLFKCQKPVLNNQIPDLYNFLALQRSRVPAARNIVDPLENLHSLWLTHLRLCLF